MNIRLTIKTSALDQVHVEGLELPVSVDCAFGGMWYAIVDADELGLKIEPSQGGTIAKLGERIKVIFAFNGFDRDLAPSLLKDLH